MEFEAIFAQLDSDTKQVLFAALWAAKDVHGPVDALTAVQYDRLDALADFTNATIAASFDTSV